MRPPALLLALAAAACSAGDASPTAAGEAIACAHGPGGDWTTTCRLERSVIDDRDLLIVHRPDGAFRRLVVVDGGRGVAAADGAERVTQRRVGGLLEVTLGGDRYRLPLAPGQRS